MADDDTIELHGDVDTVPPTPAKALPDTITSSGFSPVAVNACVFPVAPSPPTALFITMLALVFAVAASNAAILASSAVKLAFTAADEIVVLGVKTLGTAAIAISGSVSSAVTIHHLCFENLLLIGSSPLQATLSSAPLSIVPFVHVPLRAGATAVG